MRRNWFGNCQSNCDPSEIIKNSEHMSNQKLKLYWKCSFSCNNLGEESWLREKARAMRKKSHLSVWWMPEDCTMLFLLLLLLLVYYFCYTFRRSATHVIFAAPSAFTAFDWSVWLLSFVRSFVHSLMAFCCVFTHGIKMRSTLFSA